MPRPGRRRGPGWVPTQHGAWAMLVVPVVVGALGSGVTWLHLLLLGTWLSGYLFYFAAGLWLKARRRARYLPPVRAYAAVTAVLGAGLVLLAPSTARWGLVFAPLLAVSLLYSARRADRTVANDLLTLVAASVMVVVASGLGSAPGPDSWLPGAGSGRAWRDAVVVFAYFAGTVFYVKTMIRDRGSRPMYLTSVGFHALATVGVGFASPVLAGLFALLTVRAAVVPRLWPRATPKAIGLGEIAASAALTAVLLVT